MVGRINVETGVMLSRVKMHDGCIFAMGTMGEYVVTIGNNDGVYKLTNPATGLSLALDYSGRRLTNGRQERSLHRWLDSRDLDIILRSTVIRCWWVMRKERHLRCFCGTRREEWSCHCSYR